jgi:hypothetical protein
MRENFIFFFISAETTEQSFIISVKPAVVVRPRAFGIGLCQPLEALAALTQLEHLIEERL